MMYNVDIPSQPGTLAYRMSTPRNRIAKELDPNFPTVFFCPPPWQDSFIFYPQFDDPALYEDFNLVTIDLPGHGMSRLKAPLEGPVTWQRMAGLYYEVAKALNIEKMHFVGGDMGSMAPMWLAMSHPEMVQSLTMLAPPIPIESSEVNLGFAEWFQMQAEAIQTSDLELIEILNGIAYEFGTGTNTDMVLRDVRDEVTEMAQARMLRGEMKYAFDVYLPLLTTRTETPKAEVLAKIQCPMLFVENLEVQIVDGEHIPENDLYVDTAKIINDACAKRGEPPRVARHALIGESMTKWNSTSRYTWLTNPGLVTPLVVDFIKNKSSAEVFKRYTSPLGRCMSRDPDIERYTGDFLDILHQTNVSSQPEAKSWADLISEMDTGRDTLQFKVEVEAD